ncbi:MAG: L-seryl-tRNA(Sec) selenium transferase, partial [Armatimonadetes bacterium]|nr:L-seryl-tRNA(Sec) selenium transferase [Armatimonadota bacterium]NIM23804.1 L-seryl-tRNA(Sec) selenium transferase [Armatimonadota bacterium]NIM67681.1 L-seryl-tRNA(Sec) selenium transferase [Armatimonadota bacterium]NIM76193.1 L-seryl-tRNA(Sec) selenium transferase [Armatimonadota bacterium]NIN05882.1 L-seryl-tRNA(Sec) selenium transferase [Armatimonadota bacterium]
GSGALLDLRRFGLPYEPSAPDSLNAGADVVFFSGDKLLGGPQCGIILGKPVLLKAMRRNPFYRTFRVDKLTLSALEATLSLFLEEKEIIEKHAVMAMLTCPLSEIQGRAESLAKRLQEGCADTFQVSVIDGTSEVGGGSLAGHSLPTAVVQIRSNDVPAGEIAVRLRLGEPPIFTRLHEDSIQIDLRTVLLDEDDLLLSGLQRVLEQPPSDT